MRYAQVLSALYLGCAVQAVQTPAGVVIDLHPVPSSGLEEVISETDTEPSFKKIANEVIDNFTQILRKHQWQSLEGTFYLDNSDDFFSYEYDTSEFCSPDSSARYEGKLTLAYHSSKQMETMKAKTTTSLTAVPPFRSIDQVEFSIKGEGAEADTYTYYTTEEAQQLYEHLLRLLYREVDKHAGIHTSWDDFNLKRIVLDPGFVTYKLHTALRQKLETQQQLPVEKIRIYNKCDEL